MSEVKDCNSFCKDFCKGTERGMKGFTIVFFVYSIGSFLACTIVSQLTQSHLRYCGGLDKSDPDYCAPDQPLHDDGNADDFVDSPDNIRNNLNTLNQVLVSCGGVFMLLSIISFALGKTMFRGVEGRKAKVLDKNDYQGESQEIMDFDKDGDSQN